MKSINKFSKENKELSRVNLAKVYGGGIETSYWRENETATCVTHVHDTFNDLNGDGHRNPGESGTICHDTQCIESCPDT
ncbi:hypothetical protein [Kordia jejudonensis]|uniref:hypothetical protein n=1 Tax=Kordia jejudonensis TaxID=1348245 RepID=UPI000629702D|nr:hypothetical protein [Kordia jejudonensis]